MSGTCEGRLKSGADAGFRISFPEIRPASLTRSPQLGALSHPFFGWEGSPTKIDCRKKGTLILTSPLEDLAEELF